MRYLLGLALLLALWSPGSSAAVPPEAPPPTPMPTAARVVSRPLWHLPELLRREGALSLTAEVEVEVFSDATTTCRLRRTTGRPEVDEMLLGWLRQWEWTPATEGGRPVWSVERFSMDLRVE